METAKRILLVEDEALIAMGEAAALQKYGYRVSTVHSGEKAVETASVEDFDLILMDIDLGSGKMDGTEAAEIILRDHDLPIVFCTSHAEKEYVDKVKKITGYGYVLKNSGEFVLLESINMAFTLFNAHRNERENRKRFSTTFNQTSVGIALVDPAGKFIEVNDKFCRIIGYTKEELFRMSIRDITEPGDLEIENTYIQQVLAGERESFSIEKRYIHKSGNPIWVQLESNVARDEKGNPVYAIAVVLDITDRKASSEALKGSEANVKDLTESSKRFRQMFFQHSAVELLIDPEEGGQIIDANQAAVDFYGYTHEEFLEMSITDINILPSDEVKKRMLYAEKKKERRFEFRHRLADGSLRDVEVYSSPIFYKGKHVLLSFINNITERKKAEKQKDFLLQELNHRVKNNLMMVSALISLKSEAIEDNVDLSDLENQIDAIRMIHEKMYLTEDMSRIDLAEYINDLLSAVFSITSVTVEVEKTVEVESLDSKTSVPLGLRIISALVEQLKGAMELKCRPHPEFTIQFPISEN